MKKRILSLALAGALCLSLSAPALAAGLDNFGKVNVYTVGQFTDVPADAWFAPNVQAAYELDLMTGSSATTFNPNGNLTIAEALVLACRLRSTYVGDGETFAARGGTWYQPYVDYAVNNDIVSAGAYANYTATATRAQFAAILAAALPDEALPAINSVTSLPDLDANAAYAAAVLKLYNAGILTGSDSAGSFKPTSTIQRSEVATIVTRMADKSLRKTFTLTAAPSTPATSVSSSVKKFDGMIDADDLQGVWQCHTDPGGSKDTLSEWIFDGNQCIFVAQRNYNNSYYYLVGTFTVTSEPYNGDPSICAIDLNISFGDCYTNGTGDYFSLNTVYSGSNRTMSFNANLTMPEDCFVGEDGKVFYRADAPEAYPAYLAAFNGTHIRQPGEANPELFTFLANYIQTNGHEVTFGDHKGQYECYLDLFQTIGSNKNWKYSILYDPTQNEIILYAYFLSVRESQYTYSSTSQFSMILTSDLAQPYQITYHGSNMVTNVFNDLMLEPGETSYVAYLDPITFEKTTESIPFDSYTGYTADTLEMAQKNCANLLKVALQALHQDILYDNGYSFLDLGFDKFYY